MLAGRLILLVSLAASFAAVSPCAAQTVSARPEIFRDPVPGVEPASGQLVLGRTTLAGALRMFATELEDSVRVPLRRGSNPDTVGGIPLPTGAPKAYHRLDVGTGKYTLYFDKHQRLVAVRADRSRLPRPLMRVDLATRYPTLRVEQDFLPVMAFLVAPIEPCIAVTATVWGEGDDGLRDSRHLLPGTVLEFGYSYTCPTHPAPKKANLQYDP